MVRRPIEIMYIDKLRLVNIGPHEDKTVEFVNGLNGIVGPNGAGKSTIVNSIYAALTNDFDRLGKPKKSVVRYNTSEPSFIELHGKHQGQAFYLKRAVNPSSGTIFSIGDNAYIKGDVDNAVVQHLNVSADIIDKYVFVNQWEMFRFLSQTPAERAKAFQYLCGTEIVTKLHSACNLFAAKHTNMLVVDNSAELADNIKKMQAQLDEAIKLKEEKEKELLGEELQDLIVCINSFHEQKAIKDELADNKTNLLKTKKRIKRLNQLAKKPIERMAKLKVKIANRESKRKQSNRVVVTYEAMTKTITQRDELVKGLAVLQEKHTAAQSELEKHLQQAYAKYRQTDSLDRLKTKLGNAIHDFDLFSAILHNTADEQVCSTCGQPIDSAYWHKLKAKADNAEQLKTKLAAKLKKVQLYLQTGVKIEKTLDDILRRKQADEKQLAGLNDIVDETVLDKATYDAAKQLLTELKEYTDKYNSLLQYVTKTTEKLNELGKQVHKLKARAKDLRDKMLVEVTELDMLKSQEQLDDHNKNLVDYKAYELNAKQLKLNIKEAKGTYQKLQQQLVKQAKMQELATVISNVANSFHWNSLPKLVSQANLDLIVKDINVNLSLFDDPFHVEAAEDLDFKVFIANGNSDFAITPRQLSGGQKVILAIAFRLAVDKVFGNDVGMLFLDEPTSGLDADNLTYFHSALTTLAAANKGRQIVIITHCHEFNNVYENLIEVNK